MFEDSLKELGNQLNELRPRRDKCYTLIQEVKDPTIKDRLMNQYIKLCGDINRAAICLDILSYRVNLDVSGDLLEIKFARVGG